ncbi:hypothetical protein Tco_0126441 [Tanacetum coccineum]
MTRACGPESQATAATKKHLQLYLNKNLSTYLRGTINRRTSGIHKDSSIALTAYADADHAGYQDTRRSTSGSATSSLSLVLGRKRIEFLINKLGMRSFTPKTLKQLADEAEE